MMQTRERTRYPGIFKRGEKFQVTYRDHLGKQRSKTVDTLTQARAFQSAMKTDKLRGAMGQWSTLTLAAYVDEWKRHYTGRTAQGVSSQTMEVYESHLRLHILPELGKAQISKLTAPDIKRWVTGLRESGVSHGYMNMLLGTLRTVLNTAVEEGLIPLNPTAAVRLPAAPRPTLEDELEEGPAKAMSEAELSRFLAGSGENELFFDFLAETGLRISEAFGLQWKDFKGSFIHVRRNHTFRGYGPLKSKNSYRVVPLSNYMQTQLVNKRKGLGEPIWPGPKGGPQYRQGTMRDALREIRKSTGLPWVTFHTFRHTCATRLFRGGANPKQVQAWLGHHSVAFTLETYVHLLPDDQIDPSFLDGLRRQRQGNNRPVTSRNTLDKESPAQRD